jgi:hypothetical protein
MSKEQLKKKRNITIGDTISVLNKNGVKVSEKDAEVILDFLYFLAKLTVNQYVNNQQEGNDPPA